MLGVAHDRWEKLYVQRLDVAHGSGGVTHLELAEQEDAVPLLLQPGQQLVQQHQLA